MWIAWENNYKYMLKISIWSVLQTWARTVFLKVFFKNSLIKIPSFDQKFINSLMFFLEGNTKQVILPLRPLGFRRHKRCIFHSYVGKFPWKRKWQLTPVFLSGKSHRQRSLACYSPWGCKESNTTEWLNSSSSWGP